MKPYPAVVYSQTAIVAAIAVWVLAASLLNRGLRGVLSDYAEAERDLTFTLAMMAARLTVGALATLLAGVAAGLIDRPAGRAAWIFAVILLAAFIPSHVALWNVLPVWYHLTFLLSLVPLTLVGSMLVRRRAPRESESADTGRAAR